MTLEEILANPKMNPFFPSPYLAFVSSDNPVSGSVRRELVRVERERDRQEELAQQRQVVESRPVPEGQSGTFDDWGVVYHEEVTRGVELPPNVYQVALRDSLVVERTDGTHLRDSFRKRAVYFASWQWKLNRRWRKRT